jgi:hypothetical protein
VCGVGRVVTSGLWLRGHDKGSEFRSRGGAPMGRPSDRLSIVSAFKKERVLISPDFVWKHYRSLEWIEVGRNEKAPDILQCRGFVLIGQRPTLPHTRACSTIGAVGLNFRVRDGNGWDPHARITQKLVNIDGQLSKCATKWL